MRTNPNRPRRAHARGRTPQTRAARRPPRPGGAVPALTQTRSCGDGCGSTCMDHECLATARWPRSIARRLRRRSGATHRGRARSARFPVGGAEAVRTRSGTTWAWHPERSKARSPARLSLPRSTFWEWPPTTATRTPAATARPRTVRPSPRAHAARVPCKERRWCCDLAGAQQDGAVVRVQPRRNRPSFCWAKTRPNG